MFVSSSFLPSFVVSTSSLCRRPLVVRVVVSSYRRHFGVFLCSASTSRRRLFASTSHLPRRRNRWLLVVGVDSVVVSSTASFCCRRSPSSFRGRNVVSSSSSLSSRSPVFVTAPSLSSRLNCFLQSAISCRRVVQTQSRIRIVVGVAIASSWASCLDVVTSAPTRNPDVTSASSGRRLSSLRHRRRRWRCRRLVVPSSSRQRRRRSVVVSSRRRLLLCFRLRLLCL